MTHYLCDRAPDGTPLRLLWSPEIQRTGEERAKAEEARERAMRNAAERPMPHLEAWAIRHGLWKPET